MHDPAPILDHEDLTEPQRTALKALVSGKTQCEAASLSGVSQPTVSKWTRTSPFRDIYEAALSESTRVEIRRLKSNVSMAISTLCDLARGADSETVRLKAALEILDRVGVEPPDLNKLKRDNPDTAASVANVYQLKTGADAAE